MSPAEQVAYYTGGWKSAYWDPLKKYLAKRKKAPDSPEEGEKKRGLRRVASRSRRSASP